ncbi:hypothetical protein G6F22_013485 [Rhizopus arrhizus]|nr:hypothetical protein G6F22_013485 [Rhizopus arrhizus]
MTSLGLPKLQLIDTPTAAYIGIVYCYLPFMVLPLYANLVKHDHRLLEAAYDLGAKPWQAFLRITLPLSKAGIIAGCMLVMIPAIAVERVLQQPQLAGCLGDGGGDDPAAAGADPAVQPFPAAPAGRKAGMSPRTAKGLGLGVLLLGFAFLYLPILLLMFYSFNSSRLAMGWAGFSTRAYSDLFADRALMDAMWTSLVVAFWTACTATVLGTLAAMVMTRFKRFRGKPLFGALVTAPLVMPDVILGFSLMALLASMGTIPGFPARGLATIWIAHVTFTLCFVTVVVSSRLQEMDLSLEEAAMDLGASRLTVFGRITLPIIAPALVAGWLLAFTLSLDDVVVASFVATPARRSMHWQRCWCRRYRVPR